MSDVCFFILDIRAKRAGILTQIILVLGLKIFWRNQSRVKECMERDDIPSGIEGSCFRVSHRESCER